ncbi:hypothetical protein ABKY54_004164 [Vibrio harveyi]
MEIRLTPELFTVYEVIKTFYIDNDALPTSKTLARLLKVPLDVSSGYIEQLKEKRVITTNSQKGYMWVRSRPRVVLKK